jgi:hypothetical protein
MFMNQPQGFCTHVNNVHFFPLQWRYVKVKHPKYHAMREYKGRRSKAPAI